MSSSSWISEDEVEEAYDRTRSRTQIVLDPLQVCLYPTPTTDDLNNNRLQNDMRDALQELVSQQLTNEYGTDFIYFAFTDATIEWYSGQEPVSYTHLTLPTTAYV